MPLRCQQSFASAFFPAGCHFTAPGSSGQTGAVWSVQSVNRSSGQGRSFNGGVFHVGVPSLSRPLAGHHAPPLKSGTSRTPNCRTARSNSVLRPPRPCKSVRIPRTAPASRSHLGTQHGGEGVSIWGEPSFLPQDFDLGQTGFWDVCFSASWENSSHSKTLFFIGCCSIREHRRFPESLLRQSSRNTMTGSGRVLECSREFRRIHG